MGGEGGAVALQNLLQAVPIACRRRAKLAWRWLSRDLAGVSPLSAVTIPSGVEWKAPRPMRLMAFWYSPSTPFLPLQVSSAA